MEVERQRVEMPSPDENLKLQNHFKNLRCPFVSNADFTCLTAEISKLEDD